MSHDVSSRRWALVMNVLAAAPVLSGATRRRIYRRCGLEVHTEHLSPGCYFHTANVRLGEDAYINHGVHIENVARVEIGARTGVGVGTVILTSNHRPGPPTQRYGEWYVEPVTIGDGCWIGARSVILPGTTIGDGCLIAAGAVVTRDCEPHGLYAGVPARRVRDLDQSTG